MNPPTYAATRLSLIAIFILILLSGCASQSAIPNSVILTPPPEAAAQGTPLPYRILTQAEGVYRLSLETLQRIGFGDLPPESLHLTHQGADWPFAYTQEGMFFYAPALETRYSPQNAFILSAEANAPAPLQAAPLPVASGQAATAYPAHLTLEENTHYEPKVEQGEHWLWQKLVAPATWEHTFDLSEVQPGRGSLRLTLWGNTGRTTTPQDQFDHHWRISINGQTVLEQTWSHQGTQTFTAALPEGLLHDGENSLQIEAIADSGLPVDIATLDSVEITYPRRPVLPAQGMLLWQAAADGLQVSAPEGQVYLWDISNPSEPRLYLGQAASPLGVQAGHRYVLHTPAGAPPPLELAPLVQSPALTSPETAADYLVIGAPPLLEAAAPLLEHRAAQGLTPLAIPLQAVYDQFSGGIVTPEAIHRLLQYAVKNWASAPRYVLLLGDYTYDTYGYQTHLEYPLPGYMVYTLFGGETVSDVPFALLDEDQHPDLAIGRLPAQTPEQVRTYIQKALDYEHQRGDWQQRILAIADGQEAYFARDASTFLDVFSDDYQTELYAPPPGSTDAAQQVHTYLEEGAWLVAYFGHGSLNQWGKDRIFTTQDVPEMQNAERLPIVVNMTCLTGLFTHPTVDSLAETLLFAPQGGAAAVLAPTSLTLASDQSTLSAPFAQAFLASPERPIGDIFLEAQRQVPTDNQGSLDVLQTFLLFGDPALRSGVVAAGQ